MDLNLHLALSSAATATAAATGDVSAADSDTVFAVDVTDDDVYSPTRPIYDPTHYLDIFDEPYDYNPIPPPPPPYNPSEPAFTPYTPIPNVIDIVDDVNPAFSSELRRRRWRARRRFRSFLPSYHQRPNFERLIDRSVEVIEVEETEEEKSKKAANFECNICFDMAKQPVVTSCGHLFCWPCLYQWLHVHSHYKECPVCKGEVVENNVIPIYGRGNSGEDNNGESDVKNEEKDLSFRGIPPRPRGNRVESFRQQFVPFTGSLSERITSWRRRIDERLRSSGVRIDGQTEGSLQGLLSGRNRGSSTRWRQRVTVDNGEMNSGNDNNSINPLSDGNLPMHDGYTLWNRFNQYGISTDRLAALTADLGRLVGRFANNHGRQLPSTQPSWFPAGAAGGGDQASASSTMAIIEGDVVVAGDSRLPDPNSAGSSRTIRRGRSSNSSSLDVEGGGIHGHKRRRMN